MSVHLTLPKGKDDSPRDLRYRAGRLSLGIAGNACAAISANGANSAARRESPVIARHLVN